MSCEYCEKPFGKDTAIKRGAAVGEIPTCWVLHQSENDSPAIILFKNGAVSGYSKVNFCPMCAAPLTEPKPLTLEDLWERDGKPIFDTNDKEWLIVETQYNGDIILWRRDGKICAVFDDGEEVKQQYYDREPIRGISEFYGN